MQLKQASLQAFVGMTILQKFPSATKAHASAANNRDKRKTDY